MEDTWAWAAGLFEGEGSIYIGARDCKLALGMADRDVVARFCAVVGTGTVVEYRVNHEKNPRHSVLWRWQCGRWDDRKRILERMLPYLGERRTAKANEMLARPPSAHWNSKKTHCKHGHPFSGENLLVSPSGKRRCRACNNLSQRRIAARQKAC